MGIGKNKYFKLEWMCGSLKVLNQEQEMISCFTDFFKYSYIFLQWEIIYGK